MSKRYEPQSHTASLNKKLRAYARQAQTYSRTRRPGALRLLVRGSLATLIPLAATSSVSAQCQGGTGPFTLGPNDFQDVIVQGTAGVRFTFVNFTTPRWGIQGIGQGHVLLQSPTSPRAIASGYTVTRGLATFDQINHRLCDGGAGNFCAPATYFIGIRDGDGATGRPGWMQVQLISLGGGGVSFNVLERGYDAPLDNQAIAGSCASLPVELTGFEAVVNEGQVVLTWQTASELNNSGFELQRATADDAFRKIAFIDGYGTTTEPQAYQFTDEAFQPNTRYQYRLKQIDFDGSFAYSETVEVFIEDPSQIALSAFYPNPTAAHRAQLRLSLAHEAEAQVVVFDARGAQVQTYTRALHAGTNHLEVSTEALAAGMYYAKVEVGDRVLYRKLVVVR